MHGVRTRRIGRTGLGLAAAALGALAFASGASARPFSTTGAFVIGDQSAAIPGQTVTFWGAQWWKKNSLSGGAAPAAFKGFADTAIPACGQTWTTRPGNSSFPPATVGPLNDEGLAYMVVSSHITKDGPVISGDTQKVVLVAVDPGYGPNPGHAGTGTVIWVVCGGDVPT